MAEDLKRTAATTAEQPFADLPAGLVEEVLAKTDTVAEQLLTSFQQVKNDRQTLRDGLIVSGLIMTESSLGYPPLPTTCGVDGSYAIERLLTTDLAAAAAVAVEGLTPPSEKRYWDMPHHTTTVLAEPHLEDTSTVLRAVMLGNELILATAAPHDLIMIDGTVTLPVIYFNQAMNSAPEATQLRCSREFLDHCVEYLGAYLTVARSERSDKNFVALPKYSTRREIGASHGWPAGHDDRGMLTLLLNAGEMTRPMPLQRPEQEWHFNTGSLPAAIRPQVEELTREIVSALGRIQVFYYKPHDWLPALRVEVAAGIASNMHRLGTVVQGLKHQCAVPSMLEPYPIYLADRTVKALARSIPAFRQVTTQRISERYDGEIGEVYFAMHGYRSDSGR
jgi:NurA domain